VLAWLLHVANPALVKAAQPRLHGVVAVLEPPAPDTTPRLPASLDVGCRFPHVAAVMDLELGEL
jgi:hypothetical protein